MNNEMNNNNFDNYNSMEQNDYYSNDSYYSNNNYDNNYSDTTYEEKEKNNGVWWKILLVILVLLIIILLLLKFCGGNGNSSSQDEEYAKLTAKICNAAETYIANNPNVLDRTEPGKSAIIEFQTLANANLIETQIKNPYYDGGLFKKETQPKYYSMESSVRLVVLSDSTLSCELVDNSKDETAPELRLNGDAEISFAVGTEYEDPGYVATDDYDGDITNKVVISGSVNSAKAGEYELTYTVQDSAGNVTTKKRKIIYNNYSDIEITLGSVLDGVTPQISLKGANPYCLVKGTKFIEPGASATDNVDGNITDRITVSGNVTGNLMGSFRLVYKVEDSSGNQAIAYRAVVVTTECPSQNEPEKVVNTLPTLTLIGKNSVTINVGTEYIDLGATAYDKEDGDITRKIVTDTTNVNVNAPGIYKVIYRVTDSGGLTATITRTVTVKQPTAYNPVVRFTEDKKNVEVLVGKGSNSLIAAPKAVNENGVEVVVSTKIEDYITKEKVSQIDWNIAGKYRVIYTAVHGNGTLQQTKSIVVTVLNDSVTIGGKDAINVMLRSENCDITEADLIAGGVTFETASKSTPVVSLSENKDKACKIGTYEVIVNAKIDNGPSSSKKIKVYVVNGTPEGTQPENPSVPNKVYVKSNSANAADPYNASGVWVGGAVTGINLVIESNKPVAHFEMSKNCQDVDSTISVGSGMSGQNVNNAAQVTWTNEGANSVCFRAVNIENEKGEWSNPVKLYIDRIGPTAEFIHTWNDGKEDWHNTGSLLVEYRATDAQSGLSHFEYTYDDVKGKKAEEIITYNEATGKLTIYEDTEPTRTELYVYVRAVDKAGNKGEWTLNPAYTNIDTVKPNAPTLTVVGDNTSVVKLNAEFTDAKSVRPSGFGRLVYTIDDGEQKTESTKTIAMESNKTQANITNKVKVWAVDKAGNISDNYSEKTVTIAPANIAVTGVELSNPDGKIENGKACSTKDLNPGKTLQLNAKPIPSNADQKDILWKVDDANIAVIDENGKVTAKNVGTTVITAKIGGVTTTCSLTVKKQVSSYTPPACNVDNCISCSSTNYCSSCATGYKLSSGKCVKVCNISEGQYSDLGQCTSAGTNKHGNLYNGCSKVDGCYIINSPQSAPVCCACGNSQGVTYSWSTSGSCGSSCGIATGKTQATCKGTSRDEQNAYCKSLGKVYTCEDGYETETIDAYGCKTCKKKVLNFLCSYKDSASCKTAANKYCSNGYTGCKVSNSLGCFTYTCNEEKTKYCVKYKTKKVVTGSCKCMAGSSYEGTCTTSGTCSCPQGYPTANYCKVEEKQTSECETWGYK